MFEITASENMLAWNTSVPWAGPQNQIDMSFEYHCIFSMRMSTWTERQTWDNFYKVCTKCFVFV